MSTQRVFKYTVPVDDQWHEIPDQAVLHVECQYRAEEVQVWMLDDGYPQPPGVLVRVFGTGQPLPSHARHIGSTVAANGALVWHLFREATA